MLVPCPWRANNERLGVQVTVAGRNIVFILICTYVCTLSIMAVPGGIFMKYFFLYGFVVPNFVPITTEAL